MFLLVMFQPPCAWLSLLSLRQEKKQSANNRAELVWALPFSVLLCPNVHLQLLQYLALQARLCVVG